MSEREFEGICSVHGGPYRACPGECSNRSKIPAAETFEREPESIERLQELIRDIGREYKDVARVFMHRKEHGGGALKDIPPRAFVYEDMSILLDSTSDGVALQVKAEDDLKFEIQIPLFKGSRKAAASTGVLKMRNEEVHIYFNTFTGIIPREIRREGAKHFDYILGIEADGIHVGNDEVTKWENSMLRLQQEVGANEKVERYVEELTPKPDFSLSSKLSMAELRDIWTKAHQGGLFRAPKFPADKNSLLDPGPRPADTILPIERLERPLQQVFQALVKVQEIVSQAVRAGTDSAS